MVMRKINRFIRSWQKVEHVPNDRKQQRRHQLCKSHWLQCCQHWFAGVCHPLHFPQLSLHSHISPTVFFVFFSLIDGREYLILGLIWQIIKIGLLSKIDIQFHPELYRLLEPGEALEAFVKLPADQILLRWVNYHLKNAGVSRRVENFSTDVKVTFDG